MNFSRISLTTVALAALTSAQGAYAATFSDLASFAAATTITVTEDFESLGTDTNSFDGPITFASNITVSSQSNDLFSVGPGQSSNLTTAIGSNSPSGDTLTFDLGGVFGAIGFDLYQNLGGGSQGGGLADFVISFFLGATFVGFEGTTVAPNGGSFFGFTGLLFDRVEIEAVAGSSFEVADNVALGDAVAPVPVPATLPLLVLALGGIAALRRRKA